MNTEKKRIQIIGSMQKCFEQLGMPDLQYVSAIAIPNAEGNDTMYILCSGIRFTYEEDYYNRAMVDIIIHENIPIDKVASLRELLKWINMNLAFDYFCMIPESNALVFRTSLYVPGDQLPRNKFKELLREFFADYIRLVPLIEKLLVEGGKPESIAISQHTAALRKKNQHNKRDYTLLREGIKRVFAKVGLPVNDETITDRRVCVVSRLRNETCRFEFSAYTSNDTGQLYLQMLSPAELSENVISEAVDLADMFNSTSYVNHIIIVPGYNCILLRTGVVLDPVLDEEELQYQLNILISEGNKCVPAFYGNHPANMSPKKHLKAIIDGFREKVIF